MLKYVAALAGLIVVAVAAVVIFVDPDPPEPGDFYAVPSPLPEGPPGTVIRSEPVEKPEAGSQAWRILYLSETYDGRPTALSGLLVVPEWDRLRVAATSSLCRTERSESIRRARCRISGRSSGPRSTVWPSSFARVTPW